MVDLKLVMQRLAGAALLMLVVPMSIAGDAPAPPRQPYPLPGPSSPQMALPSAGTPNAKVVLIGNADALDAFDKSLTKYLKKRTLMEAGIGCLGCDHQENDLVTNKPMHQYVFVASADMYVKVAAAWNDVRGKDLTMTLTDYTPSEPNCGPPKPAPCVTNYFCVQFGNCSKTRFGCEACS